MGSLKSGRERAQKRWKYQIRQVTRHMLYSLMSNGWGKCVGLNPCMIPHYSFPHKRAQRTTTVHSKSNQHAWSLGLYENSSQLCCGSTAYVSIRNLGQPRFGYDSWIGKVSRRLITSISFVWWWNNALLVDAGDMLLDTICFISSLIACSTRASLGEQWNAIQRSPSTARVTRGSWGDGPGPKTKNINEPCI